MSETEDHPSADIPRKLAVNLDRMTVQELTALLAAAEAKRREKQESARTELLEKWRTEAEEAGMTLEAVLPHPAAVPHRTGRKSRKDARGEVAPKYRGPDGAEWTGRGRLPRWLAALEAEGRKRDEFLIKPASEA
jgi:DNA-binding protein H-NS